MYSSVFMGMYVWLCIAMYGYVCMAVYGYVCMNVYYFSQITNISIPLVLNVISYLISELFNLT